MDSTKPTGTKLASIDSTTKITSTFLIASHGESLKDVNIFYYSDEFRESLVVLTNDFDVNRMIFSPDSKKIMCWHSHGGKINIWDIFTGSLLFSIHAAIHWAVFTTDSLKIFCGSDEQGGSIHIWDYATKKKERTFSFNFEIFLAAGCNYFDIVNNIPNYPMFDSKSTDEDLQNLCFKIACTVNGFRTGFSSTKVSHITLFNDNINILLVDSMNKLLLYDVRGSGRESSVLAFYDEPIESGKPGIPVNAIAVASDSRHFAFSYENKISVWCRDPDIYQVNKQMKKIHTLTGHYPHAKNAHAHAKSVNYVKFSSDNQKLISKNDDGSINIWDTEAGGLTYIIPGYAHKDTDIAISNMIH